MNRVLGYFRGSKGVIVSRLQDTQERINLQTPFQFLCLLCLYLLEGPIVLKNQQEVDMV